MGIALAVVGFGSVADLRLYTLLILAIAAGALYELSKLVERKGQSLVLPLAYVSSAAYLILAACGLLTRFEGTLLAVTMLAAFAWGMFGERSGYLSRAAATLLAVLYIGKLLSYFIAVRRAPDGIPYTVLVILIIAMTDIFAMLIGSRWGRHPLSSISPGKTVEGAVGGLAAATAVAGASIAALVPGMFWWQGIAIGACTSVAAQVGDLVESALKRDASVKDAGRAFAGHGGVLDRFDSYLFGGIAFYAALFLAGRMPSALGL